MNILVAVTSETTLSPGVGWVRGDQAIDPKILQETERLRIENSQMKTRLEALERKKIVFDESLLGPDDLLQFSIAILTQQQDVNAPRTKRGEIVTATAGEIFITIYDKLLSEPSESRLEATIGHALSTRLADRPPNSEYRISSNDVLSLRHQLEALDLIEAFGDSNTTTLGTMPFVSNYVSWRPSEKGRRYFIFKKAKLRENSNNS